MSQLKKSKNDRKNSQNPRKRYKYTKNTLKLTIMKVLSTFDV